MVKFGQIAPFLRKEKCKQLKINYLQILMCLGREYDNCLILRLIDSYCAENQSYKVFNIPV